MADSGCRECITFGNDQNDEVVEEEKGSCSQWMDDWS